MDKFIKHKYVKYKNEQNKHKENGIISYCIQNAYQKIMKLPFYKNPTFIYSDFEDSEDMVNSSNIEKIMIEIYHFDYVFVHIYLYKEEEEDEELKLYLYMYDEDVLNKNIIDVYDLVKYKYMKIIQKYLFYIFHILFYSIYAYYAIQLLFGIEINIKNIFMIHFFHFFSEVCLLSFL
jgi:hypothetical protein